MRSRDLFSPRRWWSYHIHLLRKYLKKVDGSEWTPEVHEVQQYMYRYIRCVECLKKGECTHCECAIPERMHVRTDFCSNKRWGPFKSKEEWEKYMKEEEIIFLIKQKEDV